MADVFLQMLDQQIPADAQFKSRYAQFQSHAARFRVDLPGNWLTGAPTELKIRGDRSEKEHEASPHELVEAFSPIKPDVLRLRNRAAECTQAQLEYPESGQLHNLGSPLYPKWDLGAFFAFHQALVLRASAELDLGQRADAYADALILMRMTQATSSEHNVIAALVGSAMDASIVQVFRRGLTAELWTVDQLEGFRDFFISEDKWGRFNLGLRGERVYAATVLAEPQIFDGEVWSIFGLPLSRVPRSLMSLMEPGLSSEYALASEAEIGDAIAWYNPDTRLFDFEKAERHLAHVNGWMARLKPDRLYGRSGVSGLANIEVGFAKGASPTDVGGVIAALEIFHRAFRDYPADLEQLVPRYLPRIPADVLTGDAPSYVRIDSAHFQLNSAHWHKGATGPEWIWR